MKWKLFQGRPEIQMSIRQTAVLTACKNAFNTTAAVFLNK